MDKNLDRNVFYTIKIVIGYLPKLAWNKISYVNFCKLAQITKKNDNFEQVVPPFSVISLHFDIKLK